MSLNTRKSCIIIEDNPAFVKVLEVFIGKLGYIDIVSCHDDSLKSAVSIFRYKPDLIFLDISISGLNGLEMMETLEYKPKTIVISNHSNDCLDAYSEVRVDAFMQKPVTFDKFKEVVESVLSSDVPVS
ncbi:MAG: LytR/AlgR family response regulator transcription factor [Bacteroidota bacterium]